MIFAKKKKKTYTAHHKSFKYFNLSSQKLIGLSKSWKLAPKNITSNGFMTQKKSKLYIERPKTNEQHEGTFFFISLSYYHWFIISYYIVISFLGHFFQDDFKCFKIIKFAYFTTNRRDNELLGFKLF